VITEYSWAYLGTRWGEEGGAGCWSVFTKTSRSQAAVPVFLQIRERTVVLVSPTSASQMEAAKVFGVPPLRSWCSMLTTNNEARLLSVNLLNVLTDSEE